MTLLQVGNSEGVRRCDERCYGATHGKCECCCGGSNHGAGLERAIDNVRGMADDWLRLAERDHDLDVYIAPEARQMTLLGGCA